MEDRDQVFLKLSRWFPTLDTDGIRMQTRGPVCWFVAAVLRRGALTLDPFIFFGRHQYDPTSVRSLALLTHELKHIEQYRRFGRAGFFLRYFRDLARNRFRYSRDLPLEVEPYALQAEVRAALQDELK